ncbi:MAG TPA: hypothetical protein VN903_00830 [Polyangia bacterium]|nr:hypothetical protein [Polyangia bacterium]
MTDPKPGAFTTLFREALVSTLETHVTKLGIDRDGWLKDADAAFRKKHRQQLRTLNAQALAERKRDEQRAFIRNSRHPAIEQHKELARIARAAGRSMRIEHIEIEPGQYIAKRVIDCSRRDLLVLAAQYETKARGMLRRAAFYRTLERQLALAGIEEFETLSDWIERQDAS